MMLRSEFLWWFLHEERKILYQNQLQASDYRMRLTRMDVIFWETAPCQNRFSDSERRIILNFATCLFSLKDWDSYNVLVAFSANCSKLFHSGKLVLNLILKDNRQDWFGFQMGYQPFSSSNFVNRCSSNNNNPIAPDPLQLVFTSSDSLLNA